MSTNFKYLFRDVCFVFFVLTATGYLSIDFLLQYGTVSWFAPETLTEWHQLLDIPFFLCAGWYALISFYLSQESKYSIAVFDICIPFLMLGWCIYLIYLQFFV